MDNDVGMGIMLATEHVIGVHIDLLDFSDMAFVTRLVQEMVHFFPRVFNFTFMLRSCEAIPQVASSI